MKIKLKVTRVNVERLLVMASAALVVALALRGNETAMSRYEESQLAQGAAAVTLPTAPPADLQPVTVYYQDGEGYLVPVTTQVEKTDGIAKAALSLLVQSAENDAAAARMGLKPCVPEGTTFDLDLSDGRARVDMGKDALSCVSAEAESLMVGAVAQTLAEFPTVKEVSFLFDGQSRSKLTYGTDVSGVFTAKDINMETVATFDGTDANASLVRLYFPSQSGRMLVPVTRVVYSDADPVTAMVELCRGPRADSGLERSVPEGCGVKSVQMKNGVVSIDLTSEFNHDADTDKLQMLRAIVYTASQFPGVKEVKLSVEGQPYDLPGEATATWINQEAEVISYYPGVIEID
ncbi:MAG: GerMN domain-containing protein [Clostridia bacterium]|nr:GerMN domain-containing protein [Clostridia bacterium]